VDNYICSRWEDYPPAGESVTKPDTFPQPAPYLIQPSTVLDILLNHLRLDTEIYRAVARTGSFHRHRRYKLDGRPGRYRSRRKSSMVKCRLSKAKFRALDKNNLNRIYRSSAARPGSSSSRGKNRVCDSIDGDIFVFQKGHSMELVIRNQDDILSRLGALGYLHVAVHATVKHTIHFGNSRLLLPVIPNERT